MIRTFVNEFIDYLLGVVDKVLDKFIIDFDLTGISFDDEDVPQA